MQKEILESLIEAKIMSEVADTRASGKILANALYSANPDVAGYVLVDVDTSTDVSQLRQLIITSDYFALTGAYRTNNSLAVWAYEPGVNTFELSSYNDASEHLVGRFVATIDELQAEVVTLQGQLISATTKPTKAEGTRASTFRLKDDARKLLQGAYGVDDKAFDKALSNAKQEGMDAVFALWTRKGLTVPDNVTEFYQHGQAQLTNTSLNVPAETAETAETAEDVEDITEKAEIVDLPARPSGYTNGTAKKSKKELVTA